VNGRPYPIRSLADVEFLPGVPEACTALRAAGFTLVMVTNQPDIARGTMSFATASVINESLAVELKLDRVEMCPHDDADDCCCRKPRPGMLTRAAAECGLNLAESHLVGDRWRDIEAGRRAGCRTTWIAFDYDERKPEGADFVVDSLLSAVPHLLQASSQIRLEASGASKA
jgi:D-glycero-D-manno-heptose 1,7-bisphosphate phosphatase